MSEHYNQNYTKDQIAAILETIQKCIHKNHYIISKGDFRKENMDFISNYNLSSAKQKDILLKIKPDDFSHSLKNINPGFEHEVLYVFCPQMVLLNFEGKEEMVDIYTKFNIIEYDSKKRVVTISFHKRNKPLDYSFR